MEKGFVPCKSDNMTRMITLTRAFTVYYFIICQLLLDRDKGDWAQSQNWRKVSCLTVLRCAIIALGSNTDIICNKGLQFITCCCSFIVKYSKANEKPDVQNLENAKIGMLLCVRILDIFLLS